MLPHWIWWKFIVAHEDASENGFCRLARSWAGVRTIEFLTKSIRNTRRICSTAIELIHLGRTPNIIFSNHSIAFSLVHCLYRSHSHWFSLLLPFAFMMRLNCKLMNVFSVGENLQLGQNRAPHTPGALLIPHWHWLGLRIGYHSSNLLRHLFTKCLHCVEQIFDFSKWLLASAFWLLCLLADFHSIWTVLHKTN